MSKDNCKHARIRTMTWPDNGQSDLCTDCLLTRHHWEQGETEWQDHKYKTPKDWYLEAAEMQHKIEMECNQEKPNEPSSDMLEIQKLRLTEPVISAAFSCQKYSGISYEETLETIVLSLVACKNNLYESLTSLIEQREQKRYF